jgi:hypothetical protein
MNKTCMLVRLLPPYTNHDMVNVLEVKGIRFILFVDNLGGQRRLFTNGSTYYKTNTFE